MYKNYTTLHWIYVWGGLTILFGAIQINISSPWDFPMFIIVLITGLITIGGFIYGICKYFRNKRDLRELFEVYYEPKEDDIREIWEGELGNHQFQITLRAKANVHVSFIGISFGLVPNRPHINSLYDWNFGIGKIENPNVFTNETKDNIWHWNYLTPLYRPKSHRIKIGIDYTSHSAFKGNLKVGLSCSEGSKDILLPFEVLSERK